MTFYDAVEELGQKLYDLFIKPISTTALQFLRGKTR